MSANFNGDDNSAAVCHLMAFDVSQQSWMVVLLGLMWLATGVPVHAQPVQTESAPTVIQPSKDQLTKETLKAVAGVVRGEEALDFAARPDVTLLSPSMIYSATLSNGGAWAAAGVGDWTKPGELLLWDVKSRQLKYQLGFKLGIRALAFSPDDRLLAAGTYTNEVVIVDVAKASLLTRWTAHGGGVNGLAFSPNGKLLASASVDRTVKLWDVTLAKTATEGLPLRATLSGHSDALYALGFAPDGKQLYSAGKDQKVFVWNVESQQVTTVWDDVPSVIETLAVSPDGNSLALGLWNGTVELRKTADGSLSTKLNQPTKASFTTGVRFAKSSPLLASAASDGVIKIWELPAGKLVSEIAAHQGPAFACVLNADGTRMLSAGFDGQALLWDIKTNKRLFQLQQSDEMNESNATILAVTWARDRSLFVTSHTDGSIRVRHPQTGRTLKLVDKSNHRNSLALSPDNKFLAAAGQDPVVSLWDISGAIGQPAMLKGHSAPATSVVFTPDGKRIFAGAADGSVRQWETSGGVAGLVLEAGQEPVLGLDCAANGNWLAASQGADISLWNLSKLERQPWLTLRGQHGPISILAFAPQQPLLALTTDDNQVHVWSLAKLKQADAKVSAANIERRELTGHEGSITCLSFSTTGKWLASGSQDKTVRLWSAETGRLLQVLKADSTSMSVAFGVGASTLSAVAREKVLRTWHGSPYISFAAKEGRYIKLKSLSEVAGGPCAVVAEIRVLEDGEFVPNQDWKLVSVDSADAKLPGTLAFDGKPETHWHTPYQSDAVSQPHHIVIDLGKTYRLSGLSVLHRSDVWAPNGSIKDYEFYVGKDAKDFGAPVSKGQFAPPIVKK